MKIIDLVQGSKEWHAHRANHFNASDAPTMMGVSPYKTRSQLLREMHTGISQDFDSATQRVFDNGHRFEALARPIAEADIGEELYPVVGVSDRFSASFDGITMDGQIIFEHKTLKDEMKVDNGKDLPLYLRIQMEHQLMVSGAEKCYFMGSLWDADSKLIEDYDCWYYPDLDLREQIVKGWEQFAADLDNYAPEASVVLPDAVQVMALPALSIQVSGSISLIDNLSIFGQKLNEFIEGLDKNPSDDQAFANTEAAIKTLENAQKALEAAEASALAQTASIDEMRRTVALYAGQARSTRLMLEKLLKARKESIKAELVQAGKSALADHITILNKSIGKPYISVISADFAGAIKGKKTVSGLREAIDSELVRCKIEASVIADKIKINLNTINEFAADYKFLFNDERDLVMKNNDDLVAIIKMRIADHRKAEEKRLEIEREKIRQEEEYKARIKVEAEVQRAKPTEATHAIPKAVETRQAPQTPVASNPPLSRPTDSAIIEVVAEYYKVNMSTARQWILDIGYSEKKGENYGNE